MASQWLRFGALIFTALAMAPALAHLSELPNKMDLSRDEYLVVQQIYRGWALFGFVVLGALICNFALTFTTRGRRAAFGLALLGFLCIVATQAVFWSFTYPANIATDNWTRLPADWQAVRHTWELSHAASAVLNLTAFVAVAWSVLLDRG